MVYELVLTIYDVRFMIYYWWSIIDDLLLMIIFMIYEDHRSDFPTQPVYPGSKTTFLHPRMIFLYPSLSSIPPLYLSDRSAISYCKP